MNEQSRSQDPGEVDQVTTDEGREPLSAYLAELEREFHELPRLSRSWRSQLSFMALGLLLYLAGSIGWFFVSGYVLLPVVLVPAWTLLRHEHTWRQNRRDLAQRIHTTRERLTGPE